MRRKIRTRIGLAHLVLRDPEGQAGIVAEFDARGCERTASDADHRIERARQRRRRERIVRRARRHRIVQRQPRAGTPAHLLAGGGELENRVVRVDILCAVELPDTIDGVGPIFAHGVGELRILTNVVARAVPAELLVHHTEQIRHVRT